MKHEDLSLLEVKYEERPAFIIWQKRFAEEYNRSPQARTQRIVDTGFTQARWDETYRENLAPYWIKDKKKNIGWASVQRLDMGKDKDNTKSVLCVCDVYVDPKYRHKGILAAVLLTLSEADFDTIIIDELKFKDNMRYYFMLGYRYLSKWPEQDLLLLSKRQHDDIWVDLIPNLPKELEIV